VHYVWITFIVLRSVRSFTHWLHSVEEWWNSGQTDGNISNWVSMISIPLSSSPTRHITKSECTNRHIVPGLLMAVV